jgi:uridylate kinase
MRHKFGKTVVVALGGSIIYPDQIDTKFLKRFKKFVERFNAQGKRFVLVVGGGSICRTYQRAAAEVSPLADEDKDWLGIHVTRTNAHLVRTIFRDIAHPVVIDRRHKIKKAKAPVIVGGGWHPGWSTDYVATVLAYDFGAAEVVVAGKPDFVYDKDPYRYKNARPLPELSWKVYRRLIPKKWVPGFHSPVDPVAARFGDEKGVKAIVINGSDLGNFGAMLKGKEFKGTVIS